MKSYRKKVLLVGLDNYISLKSKRRLKIPDFIDVRFDEEETDEDGNPYFEYYVLYWRKWWSFRNDVMNEFGFTDGDYSFPLTAEQIEKIQDIYNYYNSKETWQEDDSIWNWEEVQNQFPEQNKVFEWLKSLKELHPNVEVLFYDSY